ncbi:alpha/beta hydrolase [Actinospica robiniae]|uniref:alpha/beta hydrolase n=1 Tax=Actinospica robiniae TaxID=304901 RepID=UPI001FDEAF5C|nr:alpha/beta hydrolase [Actinospica robiniae]
MLGHSYGSLVVGLTAEHSHLPVNNIVLVGSPGVEASNASQLGIPASHVWTGRAPANPVAGSGWFGTAPTDPSFGANQFTVDSTGGGPPMWQHGDYFDDKDDNVNGTDGGSSLTNIAYIISGQQNKVTLVHPALPPQPRTNPLPSAPSQIPSTSPRTPDPQP